MLIASITHLYLISIEYVLALIFVSRRNVCLRNACSTRSTKCLSAEGPVGGMSVGDMSDQRNVCWRIVDWRNVLVPLYPHLFPLLHFQIHHSHLSLYFFLFVQHLTPAYVFHPTCSEDISIFFQKLLYDH